MLVAWLAGVSVGGVVCAQAEPRPGAGKDGYTLLNPTPRGRLRDMSTDRPDTTESPHTVDAGHVQIELSFVDLSFDRSNEDSQTTRAYGFAPMLLKVGLLNDVDLQVGIDPYSREHIDDRPTGAARTIDGFGDTMLRLKVNLLGNDGGDIAFALMPFVKFPTADGHVGNGNIEGGLIAPVAIELPGGFSLGMMAEVDFIRSAADDRYVVDFAHTAVVGRALTEDLEGYVEYAGFVNLNGDEDYRGYADAGLAYAVTSDVQLDTGVRFGLTEAADDVGVFAGLSLRF